MTLYKHTVKEITCKGALNKIKRKMPYSWDLNIYRGCIHRCIYCYALYSHKYLESSNYFDEIFVKTNIAESLERTLFAKSWKREIINIGGVTDSYQKIEQDYKLMPEVLKLLIKYKTPCIISTKSDLILRDFDLINELSRITYVNIASTVTAIDEKLRKIIEPNATSSQKRFEFLKIFSSKTNASTGVHFMPFIPFVTDSYENVDSIYSGAKECGVDYVLPGILYLRSDTKNHFFSTIEKNMPQKKLKIKEIVIGNKEKKRAYKDEFYIMLNSIKQKHSVSSNYTKPIKDKLKTNYDSKQLSLF